MRTTYNHSVGGRGRRVLPAELRSRGEFDQGSRVTLIDTGDGLVLLTSEQLMKRIGNDLAATGDLVAELRQSAGWPYRTCLSETGSVLPWPTDSTLLCSLPIARGRVSIGYG